MLQFCWFLVSKCVRQSCIFPYPFNLYEKHIIWKAELDSDERGMNTDVRNIKNLRNADDIITTEIAVTGTTEEC